MICGKTRQPRGPTGRIGDPVAAVERANSLVIVVLAGLLKRKRSIAAALMYVLALGRDVRANCWDLSEQAGLEPGYGTFHRLLGRYRWSSEQGRDMLPRLAQEALGAGAEGDDEIGLWGSKTGHMRLTSWFACSAGRAAGNMAGL